MLLVCDNVWLVTDVDVSLEETPCVAEVYVDCRLLVVEGDSDIVFVSDADKLLIVLVAFSPFVDEKILVRVDLFDVAADVCIWLVTDVDVSLEKTPCVAEVYVACRLLVVEGDSDIVFVSDADKLFNVLVGISSLVDENILEREELVDVAADAVEWVGTPDGVLDSMLLACLNVLADVGDSVDLLIVMFLVAPDFSDVVSIVDDAEVYVGCGLLVVEDDSDIVLVSVADKLLNVLVAFSPLVDEMILERVELVDIAADAVNVDWV